MKNKVTSIAAGFLAAAFASGLLASGSAYADPNKSGGSGHVNCPVSHAGLQAALRSAVAAKKTFNMWGVVVNRTGVVCAVAFSGSKLTDQWLLSRQIAAAKAFTTNGLSNSPSQKFTTAQLDAAVQPGGGLFGLAFGNPVDPAKAYAGPQSRWGTSRDPMVGEIVGGTITFGGGTPLEQRGKIVGGIGVSGDTAANDQRVSDAVAAALK
jgi:uncharacterized protein GlcG (DUF336 family)